MAMTKKYAAGLGVVCTNICYEKADDLTRYRELIHWAKGEYPNLFPAPQVFTGKYKDMAVSAEDALILAKAMFKNEQEKIPAIINYYYADTFTKNLLKGRNEDQIHSGTPSGIDPESVITLEEVAADTTANMDGQIPHFAPVSIPLDQDQRPAGYDPTNPARAYITQQQIPPQSPQGAVQYPPIHRVDNPAIPVGPRVSEPDDAKADLGLINFGGLQSTPIPAQPPAYVNKTLPKTEPVEEPAPFVGNTMDNSEMIKRFPKIPLKHIQQLANANCCSVLFEEYPAEGIISVTVLDERNQVVPWKSFCIDSGRIIDARIKLIAGNPKFDLNKILENMPMYELFSSKGGGSKLLDTRMLEDIFQAGMENIGKKRMYRKEYQTLNTKIALITAPTRFVDKESRNSLQNYLMKMDRDGYFDEAIKKSPGCRFVFATKRLDPKHLARFTLINEGVPGWYGGPVPSNLVPIIIESDDGKIDIRTNPQSIPESPSDTNQQ